VFDGLTEYVLQQRVAFRDAARAHRRLVTALGAAAPGPPGLLLPLAPSDWLRLGSIDFRRAGVDGQRARALRAAARAARHVDSAFDLDGGAARSVLAAIPGCGPWTVEITMGFVLGDPDAVPTGDLHLPHEVGRALAGEERGDDARMLELLEPFRGHRFRVLRLLLAAGRVRLGRSSRP
jgi:3-methyladenine DNA glycosylase/8-oxoguanine DNA glycosylase